jgi:DNA invertase Pin-like site-specific DNA recombinase/uncharacterized small protein (DUF1192 family)
MDDNVSGSVFEREGINRLKEDILTGNIDLLLVKDLSRLGRNNAKTLMFLDFLEENGVRVITFDGKYDSHRDNDTVGIETWFNERYVRDISKKIRANLRFKIEKGEYIGHAPYGYKKSQEKRNRLCINEDEAFVVREIYRLYREGFGYSCIAKKLELAGYSPPARRWNPVSVRRILCSRVYTGDTLQGTTERISFKSKKSRRVPEDRWVLTENTHKAIVSREEFTQVMMIREARSKSPISHKDRLHLFAGLLFCGACGSPMYARYRKGRPMGYICGKYARYGLGCCTSHFIGESVIKNAVRNEIRRLADKTASYDQIEIQLGNRDKSTQRYESLKTQLSSKEKQQENLYMDRLEGKISEDLFRRINEGLERRICVLRNEISRLGTQRKASYDPKHILERVISLDQGFDLTREVIRYLVKKVTVYERRDLWKISGESAMTIGADNSNGCEKLVVIDFKSDNI